MPVLNNTRKKSVALAIVPARGGSKGIPQKNIKLLGGLPLLAYTAKTALQSKVFDRIILSTDCEKIASIGSDYGLEVPFLRPSELATDTSPMLEAIRHTLNHVAESGCHYDFVFILQPTTPFRRVDTLLRSLDLLCDGFDSVVGLTKVPDGFSPEYLMKINHEGNAEFFFPQGYTMARRQDAITAYHRCGSVFAFSDNCLSSHGNIYGKRCYPMVTDAVEGLNIDSTDDWMLAEKIISEGLFV